MLTKQQAKKRGTFLLKKMNGDGWKLLVLEGFRWTYKVKNGPISVCVDPIGEAPDGSEDEYFCLLNDDKDDELTASYYGFGTDFTSKNPNEVVLDQARKAREVLNVYIAAVEHIEKVMGVDT